MNGTFEKMAEIINGREQRSAWRRGVTAYALELLEELKEGVDGSYISADDLNTPADFSRALLPVGTEENAGRRTPPEQPGGMA